MSVCKKCNGLIAEDEFICEDCIIDLCQSAYAVRYMIKYFDVFRDFTVANDTELDYSVQSLFQDFCMEDSKDWIEFLWTELNDE